MPNWNKHDKRKKGGGGDDEKDKGANEDLHCCYPEGCTKKSRVLNREDMSDTQKVTCSNSKCAQSGYMHLACFLKFESMVVAFLGRQGRARSWNDSQRLNNVWNKKGYELAFKMCGCLCGHGNLRKDVDWSPPKAAACDEVEGAAASESDKKRKKKEKVPSKPKLNQHGDWISQGKLKLLGLTTHKTEQDGEEAVPSEDPVQPVVPVKPVIPRLAKKQTATHQFLRTTSMINIKTESPTLAKSWPKPESLPKMIPGLCPTAETKSIPGLVSEDNPITVKKRKKHASGASDSGSQPSNGLSQQDCRDWEEEEEEGGEVENEDEGWMKVGRGGSKGTSRRNSVSISESDWPHGHARVKKRSSLQWRKEDGLIGLDLFGDRNCQLESKDDFSSLRSAGTSNFISSVNIENLPKLEMRNLDCSLSRSASPGGEVLTTTQETGTKHGLLGDPPVVPGQGSVLVVPKRSGILGDRPAGFLGDRPVGILGDRPAGFLGDRPAGILGDRHPAGVLGDRPPPGVLGDRHPAGVLGDRPPPGVLGDRPSSLLPDVDYSRPPPGIGVVCRPRTSSSQGLESTEDKRKVDLASSEAPRKARPGVSDVPSIVTTVEDDVWESDEDGLTENSSEKTLSSYRTAHSASQSPSFEAQANFEFPATRDFSPDRGPGGSWFSDTNQLSAFGRELLGGNRGDGKRDENGFIHCSSCEVVCRSLPEFSRHVRSPRHLAAADLNKQLQGGIDLGGGWEKAVLREAARREEDLKRMLEESRQAQEKMVKGREQVEGSDKEEFGKGVEDRDELQKMKVDEPVKEEVVKVEPSIVFGEKMVNKFYVQREKVRDELIESKQILEKSIEDYEESKLVKEEKVKLEKCKKELQEEQDKYEKNRKELVKANELAEKEAIDKKKAMEENKKMSQQLNQLVQETKKVDLEVLKRKKNLERLEEEEAEKRKAIERETETLTKQREEVLREMAVLEKAREENDIYNDEKSISEIDRSYLERIECKLALVEGLNEKLANEVEDLKYNNGKFVEQVAILQETNADLTEKVSNIQVNNTGLVSFNDIQVSNTSLVSLVGELQIKNQELSEKFHLSNNQTDELLARMEKMERAMEARNDQLIVSSGEVEKSNSFTKVRSDQELLRKNFVTLLQSCESFQYELDRLDDKNKKLETDLKGCQADLMRSDNDKEKINIEMDSMKATLHSASKAWDMQALVRNREMEALQYNMAVLYNHSQARRTDQTSGDVDSGIAADRVSRSSSSDLSNEDTDKEKAEKDEGGNVDKNSLEARAPSCFTPSPPSISEVEGVADDSLEPASEEDRSSETGSPPTVEARDTVASWIDRNASRQFFKYSNSGGAAKTSPSPPTPASLSMTSTLSVSPPMPSNFAGANHTAPPPFSGMNMWMSSDGSFVAIPPSTMGAPINPLALGGGATRLPQPHPAAGPNAQVAPPFPPMMPPFPYHRLYTLPGHNLYYHQ